MFRQGDVLLIPTQSNVDGSWREVEPDNGRVILAYGEVTGHAHGLSQRAARLFRRPDSMGEEWRDDALLVISQPTALAHEEHAPIALEPGNYLVRRQREYTPEAPVTVAD